MDSLMLMFRQIHTSHESVVISHASMRRLSIRRLQGVDVPVCQAIGDSAEVDWLEFPR